MGLLIYCKDWLQEDTPSTYQSMEVTSVCWCLTTRVSFPSDEWSCPGALPESSGVDQDATSFCLLRNKTWPLKQLRVWCDTAGQEVLACVFVTSTFEGVLSVGLLEVVKTDTPQEKMICASLVFTFSLFMGLTPRLVPGLLPSATALWWGWLLWWELQWHFWFGFSPRWLSCPGFQTPVSVIWVAQTSSPRTVFYWL